MATSPTALLLPGMDGSGRLFAPFLAAGAAGLRPSVVSYPPDRPLGLDGLADHAARALPAGAPWLLVAESFSGPVAVRLAARRPPGLAGLVLVATFLRRPLPLPLRPLQGLLRPALLRRRLPGALVRLLLAGPGAPTALVEEVQGAAAAVHPEVLAARVAMCAAVDVRADLRRVDAPILFLAPARDRLVRRSAADELRALRPSAEVIKISGPHMLLQREPAACWEAIAHFAARLG